MSYSTTSQTHSRRATLSPTVNRDNPFQTHAVGAVGSLGPSSPTLTRPARERDGVPPTSRSRKGTATGVQPGGGVGLGLGRVGLKQQARTGPAAEVQAPPQQRPGEHMLRQIWNVWFLHRSPGERVAEKEWETGLKVVARFTSIETFWSTWSHLVRPSSIPAISDYHIFKSHIKPVWEDPSNSSGGRWVLRLRKGLADRYFEELVLALIGETFLPSSSSTNSRHTPESWDDDDNIDREEGVGAGGGTGDGEGDEGDGVCGIVLSVRKEEDILAVWTADASERGKKKRDRIRDAIRTTLQLPPNTQISYKSNPQANAPGTGNAGVGAGAGVGAQ